MSQQPPLPPQPAPDTAVLFQLLRSWEKAYGPIEFIPEQELQILRDLFRSPDILPGRRDEDGLHNPRIALIGSNPLLQKVRVPVAGGIHLVEVDEIIYIKSKNTSGFRGAQVCMTRGRHIKSTTTLKKIESDIFLNLPFIQVHRSYIINARRVRIYLPNAEFVFLDTTDQLEILQRNNTVTELIAESDALKKLPVGKTFRPALEQFLNSFASL
ncbi:MAG: LytTR family DNA-binding domain-containing protein [Saprospiraceae bacterium]